MWRRRAVVGREVREVFRWDILEGLGRGWVGEVRMWEIRVVWERVGSTLKSVQNFRARGRVWVGSGREEIRRGRRVVA